MPIGRKQFKDVEDEKRGQPAEKPKVDVRRAAVEELLRRPSKSNDRLFKDFDAREKLLRDARAADAAKDAAAAPPAAPEESSGGILEYERARLDELTRRKRKNDPSRGRFSDQ